MREISRYETAMLAYKINKKIIKSDVDVVPVGSRHNYDTRNSNQLYQSCFRTNAGKFRISRLIAVEYNMLPEELRCLPSLGRFKMKLKTHILSNH